MRPSAFDTQEFDEHVRRLLTEWKVPGIAVAVVDRDDTIVKNYGFANVEEHRLIDDNTLFDCASTSKSFTAAAVALVFEDYKEKVGKNGELWGFGTPMNKLLPEDFRLSDPYYTENVTVEDILSHVSGLPRHDDSVLGIRASEPDCPRSVTRNLRNLSLSRPLRTTHQYCNLMYTAAAHLVAELSGLPFAEFLKERIWNPLNMNNSYLNLPGTEHFEGLKLHMATGYYWSKEEERYKSVPFFDQPEGLGAGSIFSTVSDYAKWIRCMLRQSQPLSQSSHAELIKPRAIAEPEKVPKHGFGHQLYALGWEIQSYRGHRIIGHDGAVWGFGSTMKYLPDLDWAIVLFANGNEGANECIEAIAMTIIDEVVSVPKEERIDWNKVNKEELEKADEDSSSSKSESGEDESQQSAGAETVPLERYAGIYYNKGYHSVRLQLKDDKLFADCTDRSFPFYLELRRKGGNRFSAEIRDALDGQTGPCKVQFELGEKSGEAIHLGIDLVQEMDGELIWFDRVADL